MTRARIGRRLYAGVHPRGMAGHTYRLIVEGELSERVGQTFEGMECTCRDGNTALTGYVRDQSELQALLRRFADLGLTLLEAKTVGSHSSG
jgi:hypothetical protein